MKLTLIAALALITLSATTNSSAEDIFQKPQPKLLLSQQAPLSCSNTDERPCTGNYGNRCYRPARGEQCYQGYVCGFHEKFCEINGQIRCYNAAQGQTCP